MNEPTKRPWKISDPGMDSIGVISVPGQMTDIVAGWVCVTDTRRAQEEDRANAAHIVKCVNAHDDLVAACTELLECHTGQLDPKCGLTGILDRANAALAKAKKGGEG